MAHTEKRDVMLYITPLFRIVHYINQLRRKRTMMKRLFVPALFLAFAVGTAKAGAVTSSLAFADMGTTSVNTGNINTATTFTFGDLISTHNSSGIFSGPTALPDQNFGSTSFGMSWAVNTSFSISSTAFGTFKSISISETVATPGLVEFSIAGNYTGGTFDQNVKNTPATLLLTFIQDPAFTGVISGSGLFTAAPQTSGVGPLAIPEPATLVMGLTSIVGGGLFYLRRRRATKAAA
jgi:hypothetical protein